MIITLISDVLKGTDVLEGTINEEDEWIRVRELHRYCLARAKINYAYSSRGKNIHCLISNREGLGTSL